MNLFDIDLEILKLINQPFNPAINILFIFIIFSVYGYLAFTLFYFFKTKQRNKMFRLLLISIIGIILVNALKFSVNRPRPSAIDEGINQILVKSDSSFPSSHTFIAILCAFFIPKTFSRYIRFLIRFYLIILIPIGLIYIGVHYPSDVLAGALISIFLVKLFNESRTEKVKSYLSLKF